MPNLEVVTIQWLSYVFQIVNKGGLWSCIFIKNVSVWLGGVSSFAELNQRLPDVADVIYEHDTTGMAEPFLTIESRLKSVFADAVQMNGMQENTDIRIVTHAFAIKTIFHLFVDDVYITFRVVCAKMIQGCFMVMDKRSGISLQKIQPFQGFY